MGNHRIARIVGLIHIHVKSLESVWLPMLRNRVCLSRSDFFHPFFSIVKSYLTIYIWWNSFQCHVTIDYHHHLVSMAFTGGTHLFSWRWSGRSDEMNRGTCISWCKTHQQHVFPGGYRDPNYGPFQVLSWFVHHVLPGGSLRLWLVHHVRPQNAWKG